MTPSGDIILPQYQLTGDAPPLAVAVSGTSGVGDIRPQVILSHPPPLPSSIAAAAADAGLVPPSGAPPPGAFKVYLYLHLQLIFSGLG